MPLRFLTAGESHGPALMGILDGMPAGLSISVENIQKELARRQKGTGSSARMALENDQIHILAGVMDGMTIGSPLGLMIENQDHQKWVDKPIPPMTTPRPGHADLVGALKYDYHDLRPALERASARETAMRVAIGAICKQFLAQFGIHLGGYVISIGEIEAHLESISLDDRICCAESSPVRCPDPSASIEMENAIRRVMEEKNTLGGSTEVVVNGLPIGLGSYAQWDRRLDARLGAALLSIPAIKGIEIGPAIENAYRQGTEVQDPIREQDGSIVRSADRSGGLEGGISTGQPLTVKVFMKPIATTLTPQPTIDLSTGQNSLSHYERSDFCPVPRAVPVIEAMTAYVIADALIEKLGGDSISEMETRYASLKKGRLTDLSMDNSPHYWWPS